MEGVIRQSAPAHGLVDVKVCAVHEAWSGLHLVYRGMDRHRDGCAAARTMASEAAPCDRPTKASRWRNVAYRRVNEPTEVVVIFKTHLRDGTDEAAYRQTLRRMRELVAQIPGFTSIKGFRREDGEGIDIVRFAHEEALRAWREHPEHLVAQRRGREEFYDHYRVQVGKVVREYKFRIDEFERKLEAKSPPDSTEGLSTQ